jgi:coenzyme F420-0:L-glutamate ligase/coenzyme F420-1:gamma-L-glutamate ligase
VSATPGERTGVRSPDGEVHVLAVRGVPEIRPGDDLAGLVGAALDAKGVRLQPFDVVVVAQKVVSKAEGRMVALGSVTPSARAHELAAATGADARLVEIVLSETVRLLRPGPVLVCETRHGLVCANAGVDMSNAAEGAMATLLPVDPEASATRLRAGWLERAGGGPLGVIVTDTFGRPFRLYGVNVAIGVAGMPALTPHAGERDATGYVVQHSELATADEIASAAELVMGKVDGVPMAVVRGLEWVGEGRASDLIRDSASDLFRT